MQESAASTDYCADLVRKQDPDRFMTVMLAPRDRRADLVSLYAFNLEVAKTREAVSESLLGDIRLQWWRDAVGECFSGTPRRHSVVDALFETIQRRDLPREPFERLLDAREADLDDDPPATMVALETYLEGTTAPLSDLALAILGVTDGRLREAGREAALAFGTIGQIRALPSLLRQRRHRLPADLLAETGVDTAALSEMLHHPALSEAVKRVCAGAEASILAARSVRPGRANPVLSLARIADVHCRRLVRNGYNPFHSTTQGKPVFLPLLLMFDRMFQGER